MWRLPPFLGQATSEEFVVLCQPAPGVRECVAKLYCGPDAPLGTFSLVFHTHTCSRFAFGVLGAAEYTLLWTFPDGSSDRTVFDTRDPEQLIFVSCDMLEAETSKPLWKRMEGELTRPTALVHLGDQVYADACFRRGVALLQGVEPENYVLYEDQIISDYAQRYIETWARTAPVLSKTSNYYLWDDHEIVNDYDHAAASPVERFVASCAAAAYRSYQESALIARDQESYNWRATVSGIELITVERTHTRSTSAEVLSMLANSRSDRVCLCFASGPIPKPSGVYGRIYALLTGEPQQDAGKFWAIDELRTLYEGCCAWLSADRNRKLAVIGGDLHFGTCAIVSDGSVSFPVVVASPISNQPTFDRWVAAKGMKSRPVGRTVFTPLCARARRCYAVVETDNFPLSVRMVYSNKNHPERPLSYLSALASFAP